MDVGTLIVSVVLLVAGYMAARLGGEIDTLKQTENPDMQKLRNLTRVHQMFWALIILGVLAVVGKVFLF